MNKQNPISRNQIPEIILFLIIVIFGVLYVRYNWIRIENDISDQTLRIARSIEATLPKEDLKALEAKPDDIQKPQYQVIKNTLKAIIRVNSQARFAYLCTEQNGKLYFIADSEPDDSKDYSPPGQEYTEADLAYYQPFKDGKELITVPVSDRWGTWRSVVIPVKDEATGKTTAIFAMDFNAKLWNNFLLFSVIESSALIVLLLIVLLISVRIKIKNKSLNNEIIVRKQAESGQLDSENQKAAILKAIPDLLFVFNKDGKYLEVYTEDDSKLFEPRETLIGKNISDLFPPEIAGKALAAFTKSLQSKELVQFFYSTIISGKPEFYEARIVPASENTLLTIVRDISERKQAEEVLFQSQERSRRQRNSIARIAEDDVISYGDINSSFERLTEEITTAIQVDRASIWLFSDDKTVLQCISLFENKTKNHSSGAILNSVDYPRYFDAINNESRVSAGDAQKDPRTSEFTQGYLTPLGISSMLDAGIYAEGELKGVVCFEHTAEKRTWYSDEESFASTIASIVAQTLANAKRKHAEKILHAIITENPISIQIVDKEGFTLQVNSAHTALFGAVPPAGYSVFDDFQSAQQGFGELIERVKNGEVVHFPDLYYNAHHLVSEFPDVPVWIQMVIFPLNDSAGKPEQFVLMHENITGRRQAESTIKRNLRFTEALLKSMPVPVFFKDTEGRYLGCNEMFCNLLDVTYEEIIGKTAMDLWPADQAEVFHQKDLQLIANPENQVYESKLTNKNGNVMDVFFAKNAFFDENGKVAGIVGAFIDITERKKMIASLEEALVKAESGNRLKTAFMNNISHEIRTPLNGILGFSNLITLPEITDEEKSKYYSHIETNSNRLLNTITNYMDISLIASGNMEVNRNSINLHQIFQQLFDRFQPLCAGKKIELHLEIPCPAKPIALNSDAELFRKIMSHLLDNAIKFTARGEITFGYSINPDDDPAKPEFFVSDTGIGIKPEALSLIFESFKQEELSRNSGFEGSGLGLSIAKGLAQLLGGEINVKSVKGAGSKFFFTLPGDEIAIDSNPEDEVINLPILDKPVILIAEDDESNLFYLEIILKKKSVSVLSAINGKEAVDKCREHPEISLVLMDIKMPVMDGLQATREIKSFRKDLPIVACTAFALSGDTKMARDAGCDDYLPKPVNKQKLLDQLKKYGVIV
ncbi:MAG: PAS domain-containing protein [Bacteroidetes bacterium]|nr:PAS domain-containing protein [Bacteroidota bacterium]